MLEEIKDIPSLPQVALDLVRHLFCEDPDIQRIASIIEHDPSLTARLFKTVNSAAFGLRTKVTRVSQAISLMGLEQLKATTISIAVGEYFLNEGFGQTINTKNFCLHSLAAATALRESAEKLEIKESESLYLIGLLHDLGILILDALPNRDYGQVLELARQDIPLREAERMVYQKDSRQIWDYIAESWHFPPEIIALRSGRVTSGQIKMSTSKLLNFACRFADKLGFSFLQLQPKCPAADFDISALLGETALLDIHKAVDEKVQLLSPVLELPPPKKEETFRILWHIAQDLRLSNSRFQKTNRELESRVEVLQELTRVFTGIIKSLNGDSLAFSILEALIEGFRIDSAFLLHSTPGGKLQGFAATGSRDIEEASIDQIVIQKDLISPSMKSCMETGHPLRVKDPAKEERLLHCLGTVSNVWLAPIQVRGRFTAILGLGVREDGREKFENEDFGKIVNIISGEIGLSLENSRLYNRMRKEARTDPLTSISNRRTIMSILASEFARYQRKAFPLTVAIFDMDNFKSINDNHGHLAGDEFLVSVAGILKAGMREADYVGRYGGDEFIAVFPYTAPEDAQQIVERIRKDVLAFCNQYDQPDQKLQLSISVGIAAAQDSMDHPDTLLKLADKALYQAKDLGRNHCVVESSSCPSS